MDAAKRLHILASKIAMGEVEVHVSEISYSSFIETDKVRTYIPAIAGERRTTLEVVEKVILDEIS